jgi:hypothetical protein
MFMLIGIVLWIRGVTLLARAWESLTIVGRVAWTAFFVFGAVLSGYVAHRQFGPVDATSSISSRSWFYRGFALAACATVFAAFAPSYYLAWGSTFRPIVHVHVLLFTLWVAFLYVQTSLASDGHLSLHRRLGVVGLVLAIAMVVVGVATALTWTSLSLRGLAVGAADPLAFLLIPLGNMALFAIFVGAALVFRARAQVHKRLMILATISVLDAAVTRLGFPGASEPAVFFVATDLFLLAAILRDLIAIKRVHAVYALGGALLVGSQYLRLWLGTTEVWRAIAAQLVA